MNPIKAKISTIFRPAVIIPKDVIESHKHDGNSISQRLMLELGLIKQSNPGSYTLLPVTMRSVDKLIKIVDLHMMKLQAQKVKIPSISSSKLWEISGRINTIGPELFQLKDRYDRSCILSPTYEESVTDLISSISPMSYKNYPLFLYQISTKYRDEIKPRFGLIRSRQFLMKDMYSFDVNMEKALYTYGLVVNVYKDLFEKIGVNFVKDLRELELILSNLNYFLAIAIGSSGTMGGNLSHEFHYESDVGEDKIMKCLNCQHTINLDISEGRENCQKCTSNDVEIKTSIEVGHTFLLGDKYSKPFKAMFLNSKGKPELLQMGSYGLGLTRIIAAAIEVLSKPNEIRWPLGLVPYTAVIIGPKAGSKEEPYTKQHIDTIYSMLNLVPELSGDIIWDDRNSLTIGKRVMEAKRLGIPFIVVIGAKAMDNPPTFDVLNVYTEEILYLKMEEVFNYFQKMDIIGQRAQFAGLGQN